MWLGANPPVAGRLTSVYSRFEFGPEVFSFERLPAVNWLLFFSSRTVFYYFCLQCLKCFFLQRGTPVWECEVEGTFCSLLHCLPESSGWKNRENMTVWYHLPCQWSPTRNNCGPALCLFMSRGPKQVTDGTVWITAVLLQSVHAQIVACPSWVLPWAAAVAALCPP